VKVLRALILRKVKELEFIPDYPEPATLKKVEVLVRVRFCGICGSDLEAYQYGKVLMPIILGHEFSGEIVEIGTEVTNLKVGDHVTAYPGNFCGKCDYCIRGQENLCRRSLDGLGITINGAFAEYVKVPAKVVCKLPDKVSFQKGTLTEPLSVGYHGVKLSGIQPDNSAAVIGAGSIGLSTIQALRLRGVKNFYIIEPSEFNRKLAVQMGAKESSRLAKIGRAGPDFVFDCAGFPETYKKNLSIVKQGGTVVLLGIHFEPSPISFLQFITKEIRMIGSFGYSFKEFQTVLALLGEGKFLPDLMISKIVKLKSAIEDGFHQLLHPTRQSAKILVEI